MLALCLRGAYPADGTEGKAADPFIGTWSGSGVQLELHGEGQLYDGTLTWPGGVLPVRAYGTATLTGTAGKGKGQLRIALRRIDAQLELTLGTQIVHLDRGAKKNATAPQVTPAGPRPATPKPPRAPTAPPRARAPRPAPRAPAPLTLATVPANRLPPPPTPSPALPCIGAYRGGGIALSIEALWQHNYGGKIWFGLASYPIMATDDSHGVITGNLPTRKLRFQATLTRSGLILELNGRRIPMTRFHLAAALRLVQKDARRRAAGPIPANDRMAATRLVQGKWYTQGPVRSSNLYLFFDPSGKVEARALVTGSYGSTVLGSKFVTRTWVTQQHTGSWRVTNGTIYVHLQRDLLKEVATDQRLTLRFRDGSTLADASSPRIWRNQPR